MALMISQKIADPKRPVISFSGAESITLLRFRATITKHLSLNLCLEVEEYELLKDPARCKIE